MDVQAARKAALSAIAFIRDLQCDPQATDFHIEGIEYLEERQEWHVTVSFARPQADYTSQSRLAKLMRPDLETHDSPMERVWRHVVVKADNYDVTKVAEYVLKT